ncbi:MAG: phosphotransferase [bacterium]|nr:phosphotransferase [bacterium]
MYRNAGYHFLSITDHFLKVYDYPMTDTRAYRTNDFTTLIGAELHAGYTELGNLWHILAVGLPLDFAAPVEDETGPQIAARALATGAYVAVAHPLWYTLTEHDVLSLGPVHAIEVINGTSHDHNDKIDSWYMMDLMLARGHRYTACATDDAHFNAARGDVFLGWVQVKSEELSPEALLESLKQGWYYSSTGPEIHDIQVFPKDKVIVRCSPAERIFITGKGWTAVSAYGNGLFGAELDISKFDSPYGRIVVRDIKGGRAWSNPFWFE